MKPALSLPQTSTIDFSQRMGQFGFGFASAQAQIQLQRQIDAYRASQPTWEVQRTPVQNPDLIMPEEEIKEESKQEQPFQKPGRSINQPVENTPLSQSTVEFDVQDILSDSDVDETQSLLQELQQNPNPQVQNQILVDLEVRRQIGNEIAIQVGQEQGADNQEQRNAILDFVMRIPHENLLDLFKAGSVAVSFLTQLYTMWLVSRRDYLVRTDFKGMTPLYDVSYDTYIPVEKILDKPVPSHCRRILFKDEYGRTRSKVICGNVQDKFGQRVYYNN